MKATSVPAYWTDEREVHSSSTRTTSDRIASGFLTTTLFLSYVQYCVERSDAVRLIPVALLLTGTFLFLMTCPRERRGEIFTTAFRPAMVGIIAVVTVPPLVSSLFYRSTLFPFQYGLVMVLTLFAMRILLSAVGFDGVLLSFFYATSAGILVVAGLNFSKLLTSVGSTRFAPPYYDPNRIAFFAATAIPVQLWFVARRRRYDVLVLTALCLLVMVAASSRGSIGALLIGGLATSVLYFVKHSHSGPLTVSRNKLIGTLALLCVLIGAAAVEQRAVANSGTYLATKLALGDRERGLDSGFTGRTRYWGEVTEILPKTFWVIGNGFRSSDEDFNFPFDNGYLAGLYEMGLFSSAIVLAKYIFIVYLLAAVYLRSPVAKGSGVPVLFFTLIIFFANGYVHRVFFGVGDQASILVLFTFVATRHDILQMLPPPTPWTPRVGFL